MNSKPSVSPRPNMRTMAQEKARGYPMYYGDGREGQVVTSFDGRKKYRVHWDGSLRRMKDHVKHNVAGR